MDDVRLFSLLANTGYLKYLNLSIVQKVPSLSDLLKII